MLFSSTLLGIVLAIPAFAIPPPDFGFPEAPNDTALSVHFQDSDITVQEAALYGIDIPEYPPTLSVNTSAYRSLANYSGEYVVMMVDPDAPSPERPTARFILHWLQGSLSQSYTTNMTAGRTLENGTTPVFPVVPYLRPSPGTNSSAHRYIIYAFQQPSNFSVPQEWSGLSNSNRSAFNLTNFISDTGLGEPAAANYFYISNQTSVPANFTAAPGGSYPDGDGTAVTSGDPYGPTGTASASAAASGTSSSSQGAAAIVTGVGSLLGAGVMGIAALL